MSLERTVTGLLERVGLHSIKSRIIAFAVLATLIPSLGMGWLSYRNNLRALEGKVSQQLANVTSHSAREIDLWFKERRYEVRVFSSSYEVSENLEQIVRRGGHVAQADRSRRRIRDYLVSVGDKFHDYEALLVVDPDGRTVAASAADAELDRLPDDWLRRAAASEPIAEPPEWDAAAGAALLTIAEPVHAAGGRLVGFLVARIDLASLARLLAAGTRGFDGELYVIDEQGSVLVGSHADSASFRSTRLPAGATEALFAGEGTTREFRSSQDVPVVGALSGVPAAGWGAVAHVERAVAYGEVVRLRNVTFVLVGAIVTLIAFAAYLLGLTLVRPLDRLASGAAKVGAGDLEVDLPAFGRSEVDEMTRVFNTMVQRLKEAREELDGVNRDLRTKNRRLRELSITDGLTGLFNRKYLSDILNSELARSRRHRRTFAILMIDIDRFKKYNDTHGHVAGDVALSRVASVFKASIRASDYAARYGGEEFLVLLPETELEEAQLTAERIRKRVEEQTPAEDAPGVTVSVGVASFWRGLDDVDSVIRRADAALYRAKRRGRNRVELETADVERPERASG